MTTTGSTIGVPVYCGDTDTKRVLTNKAFEAGVANKKIVKIRLLRRTVFILNR